MNDPPVSAMDAVAKGTGDGIVFLANITAMLVVLVALVTLVNMMLGLLPDLGGAPITLQRLFAYVFWPVMWLIGIPAHEIPAAAQLMGTKTVLNEFIAYVDLAHLPPGALDAHARLIMTYAMCGFANFGSLGILHRRHGRDGARAQAGDRVAGPALHPLRHARHLHERRRGRDAVKAATVK